MKKKDLIKNPSFQAILTSLICIVLGLLIGYIVLLMINPEGAGEAISTILLNFLTRASGPAKMKALGNTLAKTAPLLMCALSICFCYKVGLFNIGAAGQYEAGACLGLYAALAWHMNWFLCLILAGIAGAVVGAISGALKAYRNVNEVISGIMLNWIMLYLAKYDIDRKSSKRSRESLYYQAVIGKQQRSYPVSRTRYYIRKQQNSDTGYPTLGPVCYSYLGHSFKD